MREIKFRGKSKLGLNPMVKGYYLYDETEDKHFISFKPDGYNFQLCPIEEETVGQFTGLKDKNGTEIYEGDIIEYYGGKRIVEFTPFDGLKLAIIYDESANGIRQTHQNWSYNITSCCMVIGNIHLNPELL